jgi:hypothetical protein
MSDAITIFINLINNAVVELNRLLLKNPSLQQDQSEKTLQVLNKVKADALSGQLRIPSNGIGWGLHQAVGEWTNDSRVLDAVFAVEDFYRKEM